MFKKKFLGKSINKKCYYIAIKIGRGTVLRRKILSKNKPLNKSVVNLKIMKLSGVARWLKGLKPPTPEMADQEKNNKKRVSPSVLKIFWEKIEFFLLKF